jgi:hypothetical protein
MKNPLANPWTDYSDDELIEYLRKYPDQLRIARAAPSMLLQLKQSQMVLEDLPSDMAPKVIRNLRKNNSIAIKEATP